MLSIQCFYSCSKSVLPGLSPIHYFQSNPFFVPFLHQSNKSLLKWPVVTVHYRNDKVLEMNWLTCLWLQITTETILNLKMILDWPYTLVDRHFVNALIDASRRSQVMRISQGYWINFRFLPSSPSHRALFCISDLVLSRSCHMLLLSMHFCMR